MIELEDIEYNIFILRLIIRRKFGVEGADLDETMRLMKRRLPRRAHKVAGEIAAFSQKAHCPEASKSLELSEFENLVENLVDDLVYYDPEDVRRRKLSGGKWEALVHVGLAGALLVLFMQWQGLL